MKLSELDPVATVATPRQNPLTERMNLDFVASVASVAAPPTIENSKPQIAVELIRLAGRLLQDSPPAPPDPAVKESPIAPDAINRLLEWAQQYRFIYSGQVYRFGPLRTRRKADAKRTIAILEQQGHLQRVSGGMIIDGTHRRHVWHVITGGQSRGYW